MHYSLPDNLLKRLDNYAIEKNTSKTDVVIGALAQYLDSPENIPLWERMTAVEERATRIEERLKEIETKN
jgi:metal-responsive CopG/Arc/MetJ family transcriptional regulator